MGRIKATPLRLKIQLHELYRNKTGNSIICIHKMRVHFYFGNFTGSKDLQNPQLKAFTSILAILRTKFHFIWEYSFFFSSLSLSPPLRTAKILTKTFNWGFCRSVLLLGGMLILKNDINEPQIAQIL